MTFDIQLETVIPLNNIVHGITTNTIPGTSNVEARKNCFQNTNTISFVYFNIVRNNTTK